jgi:hypothetical protein
MKVLDLRKELQTVQAELDEERKVEMLNREKYVISKTAELIDRLDQALLELDNRAKQIEIYVKKHAKFDKLETENSALEKVKVVLKTEIERIKAEMAATLEKG